MTAEFDGNRVAGDSGCNTYSGSFHARGGALRIGSDIAVTSARCPRGMTVERAYLKLLPLVRSYDIAGKTLLLSGGDEKTLLVYDVFDGTDAIAGAWAAINYYTGTGVQPVITGSPITAAFDRGMVTGDSGCNNFSGPYELTNSSITIGPLSSTLAACVDPARQTQEEQYLAALQLATTYRVTGNRLELSRADGGIAVTLKKSAATG